MQSAILDKKIFGDFQTPRSLAAQSLSRVAKDLSFKPASLIEPTCGIGAFLLESIKTFPESQSFIGVEVNKDYFIELSNEIKQLRSTKNINVTNANFFAIDWLKLLDKLPEPILITGNPPWVTNSALGSMEAGNLPKKNNFQGRSGLDAITGKANFDISEWMLLQYFEWLKNKTGIIAVLCKTSVARKVLFHAWKTNKPIGQATIYNIDAMSVFNASVDACLFVVSVGKTGSYDCKVFDNLDSKVASCHIGYKDGILLSDIDTYDNFSFLNNSDPFYKWRSGIKHDCSKVMELTFKEDLLTNGFGEIVDIEEEYLYPLLKSSNLGNGRVKECRKKVIVTQKYVGEDTLTIKNKAIKTWSYLEDHLDELSARKSSIYKNKPNFSIFGVGYYSFSPWKVAISGLYKKLAFFVVSPIKNKPTVFDDTVYFLSCKTKEEAEFLAYLLNSKESRSYLESIIFWSNKRPITIDVLKRLSIAHLAKHLGEYDKYLQYTRLTNQLLESF